MSQGLLDAGLERLGARALLVIADSSRDPDLAVFVGSAHLGSCLLIASAEKAPLLAYSVDMERDEAAASGLELVPPTGHRVLELRRQGVSDSEISLALVAEGLERAGVSDGVLALAGHPSAGSVHSLVRALEERGFSFVDGRSLMLSLRKLKSGADARSVRRAAEGTCAAFRRVAEVLGNAERSETALLHSGTPLTAAVLRCEIALVLAGFGLEQPEGNIVASGADAGIPHTQGADSKQIEAGVSLVVDLFPKGALFADCTRTFCVGDPSPALRAAHGLCERTLGECARRARPGVAGAELQEEACRLVEAAGFPTSRSQPGTQRGYVHGLGHGVGYELHELPSFRKSEDNAGTLEVGDVFTLEPGIYEPDEGYGVRIEDLFLMTGDGAENLTPLPYDLDPGAW